MQRMRVGLFIGYFLQVCENMMTKVMKDSLVPKADTIIMYIKSVYTLTYTTLCHTSGRGEI